MVGFGDRLRSVRVRHLRHRAPSAKSRAPRPRALPTRPGYGSPSRVPHVVTIVADVTTDRNPLLSGGPAGDRYPVDTSYEGTCARSAPTRACCATTRPAPAPTCCSCTARPRGDRVAQLSGQPGRLRRALPLPGAGVPRLRGQCDGGHPMLDAQGAVPAFVDAPGSSGSTSSATDGAAASGSTSPSTTPTGSASSSPSAVSAPTSTVRAPARASGCCRSSLRTRPASASSTG